MKHLQVLSGVAESGGGSEIETSQSSPQLPPLRSLTGGWGRAGVVSNELGLPLGPPPTNSTGSIGRSTSPSLSEINVIGSPTTPRKSRATPRSLGNLDFDRLRSGTSSKYL